MQRLHHVFIACLIGASTVALGAQKPLNVPLKWTPDETADAPPIDVTGGVHALRMEPVVDKREKGAAIGENTKKKPPVPIVTSSDVPAFVGEQVGSLLKRFGVELTTAVDAARVMRLELLELWCVDSDLYHGTARLKVTVTDASGRELWSAVVSGGSDNYGRSLRPINFQETLSNAIQTFAVNLLKADAFQKAVKKTAIAFCHDRIMSSAAPRA